jgi:hypothetical protein
VTDRSPIANTAEARRREAGQPQPDLREQIAEQLAQIRSRFAETWIEVSRRDMAWLLAHVDLITAERDIFRTDLAKAQAELAGLRAAARSAAVLLRATADRPSTRAALLAAARAIDDITTPKETT